MNFSEVTRRGVNRAQERQRLQEGTKTTLCFNPPGQDAFGSINRWYLSCRLVSGRSSTSTQCWSPERTRDTHTHTQHKDGYLCLQPPLPPDNLSESCPSSFGPQEIQPPQPSPPHYLPRRAKAAKAWLLADRDFFGAEGTHTCALERHACCLFSQPASNPRKSQRSLHSCKV